jgi:hypothetical protein
VTIIPRGMALGLTQLPADEKRQLLARLLNIRSQSSSAAALPKRSRNSLTTGAGGDLERSTEPRAGWSASGAWERDTMGPLPSAEGRADLPRP